MTLRPAAKADEAFILAVRNDPDVRANSKTDTVKDAWWYDRLLADLACKVFVAYDGTTPVGYGILHLFTPTMAEVSLAIAPEYRGKGHGTTLIDALMAEGRARGIIRFLATVRGSNVPSLRAFLTKGFFPTKWVYLEAR